MPNHKPTRVPSIRQLRASYEPALERIAKAGFEVSLLKAAFDNLGVPNALCFNNFAYALREFLRHVFHRLGPDSDIKASVWYKPDPTSKTGITRAHRATYMIKGGLSDSYVEKVLKIDISPTLTELGLASDLLNSFTHIGPTTIGIPQIKIRSLAQECLVATSCLVDDIAECRSRILHTLGANINHHLLHAALDTYIDNLGELATHYQVDQVNVEETEVVDLHASELTIEAVGSVDVELQYGSGSDQRNDMGTVTSESFPFKASVRLPFTRPLGKDAEVCKLEIDTSSWYE